MEAHGRMYFDAKHRRCAGRIRAQPSEPAIAVAMLDGEMSVGGVCMVLTGPCSHAYVRTRSKYMEQGGTACGLGARGLQRKLGGGVAPTLPPGSIAG